MDTAASRPQAELSLELLTVEHFSPLVGEAFTLHRTEGGTLQLRLTQARPAGAARTLGLRAPFSIMFHCPELPANQHIRQGSYRIDHVRLGSITIFIAAITPDAAGVRYEAIFT